MINKFLEKMKDNRQLMSYCMIVTFIWGMLAHAYIFLNNPFSHDSLNEFNGAVYGNDWRIQLGRVFVPAYRAITRTVATLPWLIGILALLWIGLTVFLVVKMFDIQPKWFIVLISGIFTVNSTVTATAATYIHDLDCNMFALLLAVLAVYLWHKCKTGFLTGMLCVGISLGFYQSFLSVTITLVMIICIMALLEGKPFSDVILKGIKAIGMIMSGGLIYLVTMKIACAITGMALISGNYNSLDTVFSLSIRELIYSVIKTYITTIDGILTANSGYSAAFMTVIYNILFIVTGLVILCQIFSKTIGIKEKILIFVLLALMPFGMNISCVLTGGMSHDLMQYAFWLVYLFVLLITQWEVLHIQEMKAIVRQAISMVPAVLVFTMLWGNVQAANAAYLNKNLAWDANISLFTRVVYRMEEQEEYITGETPVVFVGEPMHLLEMMPEFSYGYDYAGANGNYVLGAAKRDYYRAYFEYVLQNPAIMAADETWDKLQDNPEVEAMPSYPEDGCMKEIDGVLVVKMGDLY